jgi:hypothetical protein
VGGSNLKRTQICLQENITTRFNAAVSEAVGLAVPYKCIRKSKYPCWFPSTLKYYIKILIFDVTRRASLACIIYILHFIIN